MIIKNINNKFKKAEKNHQLVEFVINKNNSSITLRKSFQGKV